MGVHGLWDLLSPVGRRVSVETLAGKRLAIDASIWLVQFVKAMRDEKGEMVRNAHLLGFFRRICKLLFLRTKPVFVFDGGTPALKRRTVVARRRQRENAQAKVRKTAEKLLLNQLKAMGVKELAKELDIQNMKKGGNGKGKKVVLDEANSEKEKGKGAEICSQEMADEMLAASLAAEEHDALHRNAGAASTSSSGIPQEDLDDDDDEEIILPFIDGNVDPAVLAALPPSMQLDLLVQMRERLKAENREKYQQVKKAPQRFSELQIEAYLKTVAFRREIDVVQKAAAGKGVGGVQTARIASEADREFIFSSSFTGDKQLLTSAAVKNPDKSKNEDSSLNIESIVSSACQTSTSSQASRYKVVMGVRNNNHRPLVGAHVSRRRAMGIHMTRDLQRNLDLMKEFEQDNITANLAANAPRGLNGREPHSDSISGVNGENCLSLTEKHDQNVSAVNNKSTLEISFEDNELRKPLDGVDEFFVSLAAGTPVNFSLADDTLLKDQNLGSSADCEKKGGIIGVQAGNLDHESDVQPCNVGASNDSNEDELEWVDGTANVPEASANLSFSDVTLLEDQNLGSPADCEWEEGIIGVSVGNPSHDLDGQPSNVGASEDNDEDELEWEDDISTACVEYLRPVELKPKSRGSLEEEAALLEAVRRSLEDLQADNLTDLSDKRKMTNKIVHLVPDGPFEANNETSEIRLQLNDDSVAVDSSSNLVCQSQFSDGMVGIEAPETTDLEMRRKSCASVTGEIKEVQTDKHSAAFQHLDVEGSVKNAEASCSVATYVEGSERSYERICDMSSVISETSVSPGSTFLTESSQLSFKSMGQSERENFLMCNSSRTHEDPKGQKEFLKESSSLMNEKGKVAEKEFDNDLQEPACNADIPWSTFEEGGTGIEVPGTSFEDELQNLGEELINLEDEQRKLERNADFMNSEMFVECQELLHMFGIPYIIAPMEAEAQCAYMECAGLVDGVVTDDSDVFLFGARSVYKNIFDDRKYVETYFMKDMEDELGLTREKLIRMAMLLGSDYTEGVSGIGIVNAIEVVTAFPEEDGLSKFREWIESPDPNILSPWGMQQSEAPSNNKAPMSVSDSDVNTSSSSNDKQNEDKLDTDSVTKTRKTFMNKHRNVSKNWHIPPSFPSQSVVDAYKCPQVDKSTEPFSWGKPDLFVLRRFSWEKFGWDSQKVNELLLPVLQEYNKRETQLRLEAFYSFNERFAKIRSKRIKQAVKGLTVNSPSKKKIAGGDSVDDNVDGGNKVSKRKGRAHKEVRPSEGNTKRKKSDDGSEGDGRVRQKTRAGRGKRKASPVSKSCDSGQSNPVHEAQVESFDGCSSGLRRSKRSRKACKYTEDEKEEVVELLNDDDPTGLNTETSQQESVGARCFDPDYGHEDFNNIEDHFVEESLLDQGLHEGFDALNDGGFLANDADEVIAGDGLMLDDSSVKVDGSYLETGGGFCIGEDDDTNNISLEECDPNPENNSDGSKEAAGMSVSDAEDEMEVDNSRGASGITSGKLREQVTVFSDFEQDLMPEPANRGGNLPRINDSDIQGSTSSTPEAFRAMPYLRKKRKS